VLVIRLDKENKTKGGIIIPDTAKEKPQKGRVVAVGPGKRGEDGKRFPLDVKEGDHVIFSKYAGTEIKISDIEHVFMKETDILAVLD
jgi:chaperonin GroES